MVAITVILAAVIAAFVFGMAPPEKAPSVQLRVTATEASINITHNGGDSLILKNERITITNAVNDTVVDGITAISLDDTKFGAVNTLGAGASIGHAWTPATVTKGTILNIMLQDIPSGQVITQMKVTVI